MLENKCKGCKERKVGCHAECRDYKAYKEKLKEVKEKRREMYRYCRSAKTSLLSNRKPVFTKNNNCNEKYA